MNHAVLDFEDAFQVLVLAAGIQIGIPPVEILPVEWRNPSVIFRLPSGSGGCGSKTQHTGREDQANGGAQDRRFHMDLVYFHFTRLCRLWGRIVAADLLQQNSVGLVFQLVVNADLGGVIASNGQVFQLPEKSDFGKIGHLIVVGKDGENRDSLFGAGIDKEFPVVVLAHAIDDGALHARPIFDCHRGFRARLARGSRHEVTVGGNNRFRQLFHQRVL